MSGFDEGRAGGGPDQREQVSAGQEELITEDEAARLLEVTREDVRFLASEGALQSIEVQTPGGDMTFYYRGQVQNLKGRLRQRGKAAPPEEWPDVIEE